jgi:RsiW-degrading membrane proteinase PrsW (M82 family)
MGKQLRYPISTYIAVLMIVRVYLLFRLFSRFSIYRGTFADRCCAKVGIEADTGFSLKCSYKESPFSLLFFAFIISSFALGFAVRLFER